MERKFSIVIIAYNNPAELSATLESINEFSYPKDLFEVIIVDDGSEIKLKQSITSQLNYNHQHLYVDRTPTSSRAKARNIGASYAKHDWLLFIDGDQYLNSQLVNKYNQYLEDNTNTQIVLGTRIDLTEWQSKLLLETLDINKVKKLIRHQTDNRSLIKNILKENFKKSPGVWTLFWSHNFIIKKSVFNEIGKFDESFIHWGFEDVELGYKLTKLGIEYEILENDVYHFHEENKMSSEKHYHWIKNLEYFYKKYDDIVILCQWFFYESLSSFDHLNKPTEKQMYEMFARYSAKIQFLDKMKEK